MRNSIGLWEFFVGLVLFIPCIKVVIRKNMRNSMGFHWTLKTIKEPELNKVNTLG